jgi:hypothetical protein
MSPIEQTAQRVNIALKRDIAKLAYYLLGSMPESLSTQSTHLALDQIQPCENHFHALTCGHSTIRRSRIKMTGGSQDASDANSQSFSHP